MNKPDGIIQLHGREYKTVALRVQEFRDKCPLADGWALITAMIHCDEVSVIFRAAVLHPSGKEVACGFAEEKRTPKGINSTSALENAETSAIGRALAAAGFGGTEYASADELVNALNQQHQAEVRGEVQEHPSWQEARPHFLKALEGLGVRFGDVAAFCVEKGWGTPAAWSSEDRRAFYDKLKAGKHPELYRPAKAAEVAGG